MNELDHQIKGILQIKVIAILVTWFIFQTGAFSQDPDLSFEHITTRNGLSQSTITCILQDSKGFMWFGTQNGLNKYDGNTFITYSNDADDPKSLSGSFIWRIIEDHNGNIWVGTDNGLNMYNRASDNFISYRHNSDDLSNLGSMEVRAVFEDRDGHLWIGTAGGHLDRFDEKTGTFIHYEHLNDNSHRLSEDICAIYQDTRNNLWIGTMNGDVGKFDRETDSFYPYFYKNRKFSDNAIWNITGDSNGNIWICTYRSGLYLLNPDGDGETDVVHFRHDPDDAKSLSSNFVFTLFEDSRKRVWVGTENGGLNLYNREDKSFTRYVSDPFDDNSLNNNSIWSIFEDNTGNLWFGTHSGGINLLARYEKDFGHHKHIPGKNNSLSHNSVTSFFEDSQDKIWIGTDGGGLDLFNPENESFVRYNTENSSLSANTVLSILEDGRGALWVGTWEGGLNLFNRKNGSTSVYTRENSGLASNTIFSIIEDRNGVLWVGTFYGGLSYFDREHERFINFTPENSLLSDDQIRKVIEDFNGNIWACGAFGLNMFDRENGTFTVYRNEDNDTMSLSKGYVFSMMEAADSTLWIGTSGGLNKFDRSTGRFSRYTVKDGLPDNVIKGILEDEKGYLWISTNKGLSRFDPKSGSFRNYDNTDGLQDNEFYQCSYFKSRDGVLYFGGVNGFNAFLPDDIIVNPVVPPVVLTNFSIFNKPVPIGDQTPLKENISITKEITLSYRQNVFSFEFTALNYISSNKNQFECKLDGFDTEWNHMGTSHTVSYTNIDPGEYTFMVKASNNDGVWNEEGTSVVITITPPFWKTLLFKVVVIIFLIGFVFMIYYLRVRQILHRNRLLQIQVDERTKEINEKNAILLEQTNTLTIQRDALDTSNSVKDKLFSIISHDLRSPFNTLKGFIDLIRLEYAHYRDDEKLTMIGVISRSADNIYHLLDNLLNWSRSQKGKLSYNPKMVNIVELIKDKADLLDSQTSVKDIKVAFDFESDIINAEVDEDQIRIVIQNLLTNAIKFTASRGNIRITCKSEQNDLNISVQDDGIGMSEEDKSKLLRPDILFSTRGTENETGTGLGLLICKEFIEMHHGKIWLESELNKGTTFYFRLPVRQSLN